MATCPACWGGSGSGAAIMSAAKARTAALRYDAVVLCMLTSPRLFSRHQWSAVAQGYSETEEYARRPSQCRQAALPFPEDSGALVTVRNASTRRGPLMECPACRHENPAQAKFCLECGARLVVSCSNCGTELPSSAKFCLECGARVTTSGAATVSPSASPEAYTPSHLAEKILTSRSALEGERKQVTVLFADLKGSMELLADRDPEEARQLLDPVLERLMAAVHRYEGTVNQVMGDGIMALFGAPIAHEDHAVRACYAALRMQESVTRYAEEARRAHGVTVQIRVGLNSGEVVVRAIGNDLHMDYTAIGQTTHLAARMEQLARPGTALLTADTLRLVEGYVEVKPLGPVPVKGLPEPIEVYELLRAGRVRSRLQAAVARGLTRFVGRDAELEQLDRALEPMLPAFLALLEVPVEDPQWQAFNPTQRRRRTLEAVKRLLLRESQVQPLLLVCEDLHWIDAETQAVLDLLVESLPTARVLLLVNYRPEYQHGWGSKTYYTQLRLDPLPEASADTLLQALLGEDVSLAPLIRLLIARTQGNPFFLEESVRTLVETGVLGGERGAYRLEEPLDTLQVPATVQALLAARIDRLPPEDKRLLQTAAVIGAEVPWPLLQAIAATSDEALYRSLAHLQAAEFLYETSLFPERAYTFKHALTHEVASGSLLHERRRVLHARIVEALEALAGDRQDDQVERLAHHALRGGGWDKALAYGRPAGGKARTRSAYREAGGGYEQALAGDR